MTKGRRRPARPADAPDRWLILCRQSDTDDMGRDSLSLESQEQALRAAAASRGAIVIGAVRDADLKGYQDESQRPGLREALDRADAGEYDVLAVWELSRLARKLSLQERILERLERAHIRLHSQQEPWTSDPLVRQILGAVAEQQTRTISGHVSRALRQRREQGLWAGRVPYGYVLVDHRLVPDDEMAAVVRDLFNRFANGEPITTITRRFNEGGVAPPRSRNSVSWRVETVGRILENEVYRGHIVTTAHRVEHAHEPIVDDVTWERVQRRRADLRAVGPGRRYGRQRAVDTFLDAERAVCGCGAPLFARRMLKPYLRWPKYQDLPRAYFELLYCASSPRAYAAGSGTGCSNPRKNIMVHLAERFVRDQLVADLVAVRPWRVVAAEARAAVRVAAPDEEARRRALVRRRREIVDRKRRATELFVGGRIDLAGYDDLVRGIDDDLVVIDRDLAASVTETPADDWRDLAERAKAWVPIIDSASNDDLRQIMARLGARVVLDGRSTDQPLRMEYGPALTAMLPRPIPA